MATTAECFAWNLYREGRSLRPRWDFYRIVVWGEHKYVVLYNAEDAPAVWPAIRRMAARVQDGECEGK